MSAGAQILMRVSPNTILAAGLNLLVAGSGACYMLRNSPNGEMPWAASGILSEIENLEKSCLKAG
mgnify:CR=1 FL=1